MTRPMKFLSWVLALAAWAKLLCGFMAGYHPPFFWLFLVEALASLVCIIGAVASLIITISACRKGTGPGVWFATVSILAGMIGILPGFIPSAFGAITRAKVVGTESLVREGRTILATHPALAEGSRQWEKVSPALPALSSLHGLVRVVRAPEPMGNRLSRVVVKMYGFGDFAGFTIVPEGQESEGLRIADGLYWSDASGFW